MHETARPLVRLLVRGALPGLLLATGCSPGPDAAPHRAPAPAAGPTTAQAPAGYPRLPDPCAAIPQDTVRQLVRGVKNPAGTPVASAAPTERGGCSWTGLDGYQYRWLDDLLQRFDPLAGRSGQDQARAAYDLAVHTAAQAAGAATAQLAGIGDQAALITWDQRKDGAGYHYATVVARSANAVVTVDFSGAGLQGADHPDADRMNGDVQQAARAAVAALR